MKRILARGAVATGLVLVLGAALAPRLVTGRTFGRLVERTLPTMSGHVTIGGGRWTWAALFALWRGHPAALALEDLRVTTGTGAEVLRAGRVSARIDVRRGERRVVIDELVVEDATWRMDDLGDGTGLRFLSAFRPAKRGRGGGAAGGGPSWRLSIPNARLVRVNAIFDFAAWGLTLEGVDGAASLALGDDARAASGFTFDVRAAQARDGGVLRVGRATSAWTLPFSTARLERVATTRDAPDAIQLEASEIVTGASTLAGTATFGQVYGIGARAVPAGLTLAATLTRAPDALQAILASHAGTWRPSSLGGPDASLSVRLEGPYARLAITADARAFDVTSRGVHVEDVAFRIAATPALGRYRLDDLSATWRGIGRLQGGVALDLDGRGAAALHDVSLTFARPAANGSAFVVGAHSRQTRAQRGVSADATVALSNLGFRDGAIVVDDLRLPLWGGELAARGRIALLETASGRWLTSPRVDLALDARHVDIARGLGSHLVRGALTFHARAHGTLWAPTLDVDFPRGAAVKIFNDELALPAHVAFLFTNDRLFLDVPLERRNGGRITTSGHIERGGALALEVRVEHLPLEGLPGLADTGLGVEGSLDGKLRVSGPLGAPRLAGRLDIDGAAIRGRKLGQGALTIATDREGTLHAQGQLMNGVHVDGTLRPERDGPRGEVKVDLRALALETFALSPPGGFELGGAVSGTVVARIAPHEPSTLDGVLSDVTLAVKAPGASASTPPFALHTRAPVPVALRSDGAVSFGPARFASAAGAFTIDLRRRGSTSRGALRGHLDLGALAPFLTPWVRSPSGAVDVDLVAAQASARALLTVDGSASIAAPLTFTLSDVPLHATVRGGRLQLEGVTADVRDLDATLALDLTTATPKSPVSRVVGQVRLGARLVRAAGDTRVDARVELPHLELSVPKLGDSPVVVDGGHVALRVHTSTLAANALEALDGIDDIDLPARGTATRVRTPAGVVQRVRYDLRLRGRPTTTLTLAGDVDILEAQLRRDAVSSAAPKPGAPTPRLSLRNPRLDLHLHARGGAIEIELAHAPDLRIDLDSHITGTLAHPVVTGAPRPSGIYSSIVMGLGRLVGAH
ncbi:MAG: hypothetical protein JWM82_24 [Myxococcales bacterium]|nr:hypothetical protein [Myxococcales bacterium]